MKNIGIEHFKGFEEASDDYGRFIMSIVEYNRCKTVVEIGVAYGTTTKLICEALKVNGRYGDNPGRRKLYGFDNWLEFNPTDKSPSHGSLEFVKDQLKGLEDYFELYQMDSKTQEFKDKIYSVYNENKIDLAFIDGDHTYNGVKNDFEIVYPLLSKNGIIIFHDTFNVPGCRKMVFDLRTKYYDGTYDVVSMPWGNREMKCGLTLLFKREQTIGQYVPDSQFWTRIEGFTMSDVINSEKEWFEKQIK